MKNTIVFLSFLMFVVGCNAPSVQSEVLTPVRTITTQPITDEPSPTPTEITNPGWLTNDQITTLNSLEKVADFPLYKMHYYGSYQRSADDQERVQPGSLPVLSKHNWGCSLFAALGDEKNLLYGRNFDWDYSPALLLYTDPPGGYASVSMVDLAYLFDTLEDIQDLTELPLEKRAALLETIAWPFDGINEMGLTVGMAAVPISGEMAIDPQKETVSSLMMIRELLDQAGDVEAGVALMKSRNIIFDGPALHYLLADGAGNSAMVEFYQSEMVVTYNQQPWQVATNFLCSPEGDCTTGRCWRYDTIEEGIRAAGGKLNPEQAMDLLADVSQEGTQWSVVYGISDAEVNLALGGDYEEVYTFSRDFIDK
jgi:hypothetical protein